jgi:ATP-dependent DNA helicase 2 subunit 2
VSRPYACFKGRLSLGDPIKYPDTAMVIDVVRYFKTHSATAPTASSYILRAIANGSSSQQSSHTMQGDASTPDAPLNGGDLAAVQNSIKYTVNVAEGEPGADQEDGKKSVAREELARGYQYGRTAVPISESDDNVTKLETKEGFEILGFIPNDKVSINITPISHRRDCIFQFSLSVT